MNNEKCKTCKQLSDNNDTYPECGKVIIKDEFWSSPITWIVSVLAFIMIVVVLYFYLTHFTGGFSSNNSDWGTFGDYIGGILNPIFSFLSIILILVTISIQRRELRNSSIELHESAEALKKQNFESAFFQLLELYHEIVNNITINNNKQKKEQIGRHCFHLLCESIKNLFNDKKNLCKRAFSFPDKLSESLSANSNINENNNQDIVSMFLDGYGHSYITKEAFVEKISKLQDRGRIDYLNENMEIFISIINVVIFNFEKESIKESIDVFFENNELNIGYYFRNLYNILKFIDQQDNLSDDSKVRYVNIFRSQLSSVELFLLFYNALYFSENGRSKFKLLIEKYAIFEDFPESSLLKKSHKDFYSKGAYGKQ